MLGIYSASKAAINALSRLVTCSAIPYIYNKKQSCSDRGREGWHSH